MTARRYFAGIGCRQGCAENSLFTLLEQALHAHGLHLGHLAGIASIDVKRTEPGLHALATTLHLPLQFFSPQHLATFALQVSPSAFTAGAVGSPSVAEACALAAAHRETLTTGRLYTQLIIRKYKSAVATVAVAATIPINTTHPGEGDQ